MYIYDTNPFSKYANWHCRLFEFKSNSMTVNKLNTKIKVLKFRWMCLCYCWSPHSSMEGATVPQATVQLSGWRRKAPPFHAATPDLQDQVDWPHHRGRVHEGGSHQSCNGQSCTLFYRHQRATETVGSLPCNEDVSLCLSRRVSGLLRQEQHAWARRGLYYVTGDQSDFRRGENSRGTGGVSIKDW